MRPGTTGRESLERRLASYGAMAIAAALGGTNAAEASIISFTAGDPTTSTGTPVTFNLMTGAVGTSTTGMDFAFRFFVSGSTSTAAFLSGLTSGRSVMIETCYCPFPVNLGAGALIGPSGAFGGGGILASRYRYSYQTPTSSTSTSSSYSYRRRIAGLYTYGNFAPGASGFVGLRFVIGPNSYYGWANITVNEDLTTTLHSFAYEACADQSIEAGASQGGAVCGDVSDVPEPHSAALLALGAAGIAAYRRKRKAA